MVKSSLVLFLAGPSTQVPTEDRRFNQLTQMMGTINPELKKISYWGAYQYGCNCVFSNSDRPMSDPGYGLPIDPLDTACKTYRECIWCVNKSFEGGLCQPETVAYGAPTMDENGITCTDAENSCERALCECDKFLALAHNDNFHHYNRSLEWTSGEFEPTESCHRPKNQVIDTSGVGTPPPPTNNNNGGGQAAMLSHMFGAPDPIFPSNNHECCSNSGETSPYQMYLPHVKKCCDSGSTTLIDNEC